MPLGYIYYYLRMSKITKDENVNYILKDRGTNLDSFYIMHLT